MELFEKQQKRDHLRMYLITDVLNLEEYKARSLSTNFPISIKQKPSKLKHNVKVSDRIEGLT